MITEKQMTLGRDWCYFNSPNPTGWLISEKIYDVRLYWSGSTFWTRSGQEIEAPDWFADGLPDIHLDCGIHAGRTGFQIARNAVNHGEWDRRCRLAIFDVPQAQGTWPERMAFAPTTAHAAPVSFRVAKSKQDVVSAFHAVKREGGEGLMLREPTSTTYPKGRTSLLLKVK